MRTNRHLSHRVWLPRLLRHLSSKRQELGQDRYDAIRADYLRQFGRQAYLSGCATDGAKLLVQSAAVSGRWLDTGLFLLHASPPGIRLKRVLKAVLGRGSVNPGV
jgi:hypothetical protein